MEHGKQRQLNPCDLCLCKMFGVSCFLEEFVIELVNNLLNSVIKFSFPEKKCLLLHDYFAYARIRKHYKRTMIYKMTMKEKIMMVFKKDITTNVKTYMRTCLLLLLMVLAVAGLCLYDKYRCRMKPH